MLHLIGRVFTYNVHITLPALLTDSSVAVCRVQLSFLLTMFWSCETTFSLEEKAFMAFPFLGENLLATESVVLGR